MIRQDLAAQLRTELKQWQHLLLAIRCQPRAERNALALCSVLAQCKDLRNILKELTR